MAEKEFNFLEQIRKDFALTSEPEEGGLLYDLEGNRFQRWGDHRQRYRWKGKTFLYRGKIRATGTFIDLYTGAMKTYRSWKDKDLDVQSFTELTIKSEEIKTKEIKAFDEVFDNLNEADKNHPYIIKKKINLLGNVKQNSSNELCIPSLSLEDNSTIGIHRIFPNGGKGSYKGSTIGYFSIGELTDVIYICEGYATACTVHGLTKKHTVMTFGQLGMVKGKNKVVLHYAKKYKDKQIIVCLDNVKHDQLPKYGAKTQDQYLDRISSRYANCLNVFVIRPVVVVDNTEQPVSDFNDLFIINPQKAINQLTNIPDAIFLLPLGHKGKTSYIYSSQNREVHAIEKGDSFSTLMFIASDNYWKSKFRHVREKDTIKEINALCANKTYKPSRIRSAGVYLDEGNLVINDGKKVTGETSSKYFYLPMGKFPEKKSYELDQKFWHELQTDFFPCLNLRSPHDMTTIMAVATLFNIPSILPFRFNMDFSGQLSAGKNWIWENIIYYYTKDFNTVRPITSEDSIASIKDSFDEGKKTFVIDENESGSKDTKWLYDLSRQSSTRTAFTSKFKGGSVVFYPVEIMLLALFNAEQFRLKSDIARTIRIPFIKKDAESIKQFKEKSRIATPFKIRNLGLAFTYNLLNNYTSFISKFEKYLSIFSSEMNYHQARIYSQICSCLDVTNMLSQKDFMDYVGFLKKNKEILVDDELESDLILNSILRLKIWNEDGRGGNTLAWILDNMTLKPMGDTNDSNFVSKKIRTLEWEYGIKFYIFGKKAFMAIWKNSAPIKQHLKREGLQRYEHGFGNVLSNEGYPDNKIELGGKKRYCVRVDLASIVGEEASSKIFNFLNIVTERKGW